MNEKTNKNCYIIGAGEFYGFLKEPENEDYIIAADGGYHYLEQEQIVPDLVIGDFDSIQEIPKHHNLIRLPREKDDTDMMAAVKEGMKMECGVFHIYGGTGGRMDHTLANIQILSYLSKEEKQGFLHDNCWTMTVITNRTISFGAEYKGIISIFAQSEIAKGVTLKGLKYSLNRAAVTNLFPIGVSNEFTGEDSSVTVEEGTLLLVYEHGGTGSVQPLVVR